MFFQSSILDELIVDNFAGGGGASTGIELAVGRPVDIAINHDPDAIAMHKVNHPFTKHYQESVWDIDPRKITEGRPVGIAWFSPDCKHFSKAKGGKPVDKRIRGLAWIALRWAGTVRPRIILLENVEEFMTWGPVRRGKPVKSKQGQTFRKFVSQLEALGYKVEYKVLKACDYGAPTIRKRFYLIARCDGLPIVWPKPTHGEGRKPYRTAAECIDWSIPCPSIFGRKKELAVNTQRRIARGLDKFVIKNPKPFIIQMNFENPSQDVDKPMSTQTTVNHHILVTPSLVQYHTETNNKEMRGQDVQEPIRTIDGSPRYGLTAAYLSKYFGGEKQAGADLQKPTPTVTGIDHNALTVCYLSSRHGDGADGRGKNVDEPTPTITADCHESLVESHLCVFQNNMDCKDLDEPMPTLTQALKFGQVNTYLCKIDTVQSLGNWDKVRRLLNDYAGYSIADDEILILEIDGVQYFIYDVGMRMLKASELKLAQGFPTDYCIDIESKIGKPYSEAKQIARLGNAVCPPIATALVKANYIDVVAKPLVTMAAFNKHLQKRMIRKGL
ncbi:MAG: DNA cytosine methyltransferase [Corallococcus sp.]|nr:DNA cytosine methyltransferase [Corallococcus sp.]MCM1359323.1 DNA cytosine methyltransferase [Corallococcus sp.]MCM1394766.1 DNA cytosine methyltransferase [Corallococcus sp.]